MPKLVPSRQFHSDTKPSAFYQVPIAIARQKTSHRDPPAGGTAPKKTGRPLVVILWQRETTF
jgi:hypothetical protein